MATYQKTSYSAQQVYQAVPQVLQDQDAAAGYPLYSYIYGACRSLDQLNVFYFDDMGAGVSIRPTNVTSTPFTLAYLSASIQAADTSLTVFGTDSTWQQVLAGLSTISVAVSSAFSGPVGAGSTYFGQNQLVTPSSETGFVIEVEEEKIFVPNYGYNFSSPSVTFNNVIRGYEGTTAVAHQASSGANGTIDIENYLGAPGWSQILDVTRCPQFALPWLTQFIGSNITIGSSLNYQQIIYKLQTRSGFQRATASSLVSSLVAIINAQLSPATPPLDPSRVLLFENTYPIPGPPLTYGRDPYSLTILLPGSYYPVYTYTSLETAAGNGNYTALDTFINASVPTDQYNDILGSSTPSSSSSFVNFIYNFRPAGVQVFIGGY